MAYDIEKHVASLAGDHWRSIELNRRQRFEARDTVTARKQTAGEQLLELAEKFIRDEPEQVRRMHADHPRFSEMAAAIELARRARPDLERRALGEYEHSNYAVENAPPRSGGMYPTTPRQTAHIEQEDLETRRGPDGSGSDKDRLRSSGRSRGSTIAVPDSIEASVTRFDQRVRDLMDMGSTEAEATAEAAKEDPEGYVKSQRAKSMSIRRMV
jgi:hypothetical protein